MNNRNLVYGEFFRLGIAMSSPWLQAEVTMATQVWDTSGNTMSKPTSLLFNPFFSADKVCHMQ